MSSLFPKIPELQMVSEFHYNYAEEILNLLLRNLLKEDSIDVGITEKEGDEGSEYYSVITFAEDESEDVILNLNYTLNEFEIEVSLNTDRFGSSVFSYIITDDCSLFEIIPEKLKEYMNEVWENRRPKSYTLTGNFLK